MPARSTNDVIERRQREREDGGDRYVPLAIRFVIDGKTLLAAGGQWDRRLDDFDGPATTGIVLRIHAGQREAVAWFAEWLDAHEERRDRPPELIDGDTVEIDTDPAHAYAALFAGGRRAGKSWIGVALAVCYAIRFPGAIVWLVSPADTKHDEIRRYIASTVAGAWLDSETAQGWELCNGSRLMLKSGYDPEALKEGQAHLILLNEGQKMSRRAYTVARGAIVDTAGCVIVCSNPPVEAKDQQWVSDFAAEAEAGKRAGVYFHFDPRRNPHIDQRALLAMSAELDERTYAIEVLGEFRAAADAVAWNWNRLANERPAPLEADVTAMFLSGIGEGDGIKQVVGLDVQRIPYIGGPIYRFYGLPFLDTVIAWIVGEVVLDGGDEIDFCAALGDAGLDPKDTLIVCDASGRYQHSRRRNADSPPPEWKGRGSFDLIRGEGFTRIVPPDRRRNRNPEIVDRVRAFTSMIATGTGVRRLFADPDKAPRTCNAIREWKTVHGVASRTQDVAHLGDGASYPIVRLFPRVLRSDRISGNRRAVTPDANPIERAAVIAASSDDRILPLRRGAPVRRGARGRGL